MHFPNYTMRVESIENDQPGIKQVTASYHKRQIMVEYEEAQVEEVEIVAVVKNRVTRCLQNDISLVLPIAFSDILAERYLISSPE